METKFRKGDKVEAEWDLDSDQPVWDFHIERSHSGEWRTGIVTDDDYRSDGKEFKVKFYDANGDYLLGWAWPHYEHSPRRDGWIRHIVERSLFCDEPKSAICVCDSFKLAWSGHEENCAWAKQNVKKFAVR